MMMSEGNWGKHGEQNIPYHSSYYRPSYRP